MTKRNRFLGGGSLSRRLRYLISAAFVLGSMIFIVSCSDNGDDSFLSSSSEPPVVEGIPDQTINEGEVFATISLDQYVSDPDNTDSEISWTFSGTLALTASIDHGQIATIRLPSLEWNGSETITFTAADPDGNASSDAAVFTVTGVNDAPYVLLIPDQTIYESYAFSPIDLDDFVLDYDNTAAEMTWTYSGNLDLNVAIDSNRLARIAIPDASWMGSETITFRATDPAGLSDERPVAFTVNPVIYDPLVLSDWPVSTPTEQGLDSELVRNTYLTAAGIDHLYSLLIIKNGYLVAECYFNGMTVDMAMPTASATKSYTSALTGIALREGYLTSLDQRLVEFFPELDWYLTDARKRAITVREMLQMRSGYPWEEREDLLYELFEFPFDWAGKLIEFPLTSDPGTAFGYSNLTAHVVAVILARAMDADLLPFAEAFLLDPLGCASVYWPRDLQGYYVGHGDVRIRPRDMTKLGLLFLNDGSYGGTQVIPADWVAESLTPYSQNVYGAEILDHMTNISYGYMWWTAEAGSHHIEFAWGNGGQLIVMVRDLNMVVVTSADNFVLLWDNEHWLRHKLVLEMVGEFISSQ